MSYASLTLATLRSRLQDRYDAVPFWSATEANDAINEALRQFNLYTGYWRGTATYLTVAGDRFIPVPGTLTYRTRVYLTGRVLARKSIVEFFRFRRDWRTQSTADGDPIPPTLREWAPIGLATIALWPADGAGGLTLTFDAVKLTPILPADASFVDIGEEETTVVLDEALWILAFKRPSILAQLKPRHQAFLAACAERNDQLRASAFYRAQLGLDAQQRLEPARLAKSEQEVG